MINEEAKKAILKLFQCYPSKGDDIDRKIKFTAYCDALGDLSSDAVIAVCRKASRGEVGEPGFLPSAGELYQAAMKGAPRPRQYPMLNEPQHHAVSREERVRVIQGLKDLRVELMANKGQQSVAGWTSLGEAMPLKKWADKPLPELSDKLKSKLGIGIPNLET